MQSIVEVLVLFVTMNPYVSQGMVAAAVEGIGVAFGQRYLEGRDRIDLLRCFRAMLNGFFIGMLLRYWYGLIQDHVLGSTKLISALAQVAGKKLHRIQLSHGKFRPFHFSPPLLLQPLRRWNTWTNLAVYRVLLRSSQISSCYQLHHAVWSFNNSC